MLLAWLTRFGDAFVEETEEGESMEWYNEDCLFLNSLFE
jgi:hypothetical protein